MGKTYIDTLKYVVIADVEINGLVEKPDVVGALFGQTEGLLGDELDLRDLQKNGRIGRIEVDLSPIGGRTKGVIKMPSSLDMVETCILAAALETVDRVGPCEAKMKVTRVEDTRNAKRKQILDRARALLKNMIATELPESKEIAEMVRDEVKTAGIIEYGRDKLPAGPMVDKTDSIVLVEGRADVLNLLKNDISNVIAIGGAAQISPTIIELCRKKEVTVFLDGDRGGDIILNHLLRVTDVDFVARAATGKEVEELTRKEIIKCLRSKIPIEQAAPEREQTAERMQRRQFMESRGEQREQRESREQERSAPVYQQEVGRAEATSEPPLEFQDMQEEKAQRGEGSERSERTTGERTTGGPGGAESRERERERERERDRKDFSGRPKRRDQRDQREQREPRERPGEQMSPMRAPGGSGAERVSPTQAQVPPKYVDELKALENSLKAKFYDKSGKMVSEIPVRDVIKTLEKEKDIEAVVFDGIVTQRLVDLAESKGISYLVGLKLGNVFKQPSSLAIYTKP